MSADALSVAAPAVDAEGRRNGVAVTHNVRAPSPQERGELRGTKCMGTIFPIFVALGGFHRTKPLLQVGGRAAARDRVL